jgi:hypothetical protein
VAPVAVFTTETLASFTTAPFWSATTTIIEAVLGDWPTTGTARNAMRASRSREQRNEFLVINSITSLFLSNWLFVLARRSISWIGEK